MSITLTAIIAAICVLQACFFVCKKLDVNPWSYLFICAAYAVTVIPPAIVKLIN